MYKDRIFIAASRQSLDYCREACFRHTIELFFVCLSVCLSVRTNEILRIKNSINKNLEKTGIDLTTYQYADIDFTDFTIKAELLPIHFIILDFV